MTKIHTYYQPGFHSQIPIMYPLDLRNGYEHAEQDHQ